MLSVNTVYIIFIKPTEKSNFWVENEDFRAAQAT